jgi:PAS domain S-box-containing protein
MQKQHIRYVKLFSLLFLFIFIFIPFVLKSANANEIQSKRNKRVLILHSYHKGLHWTDGQENAIRKELAGYPNLEIYTEYLDSKRKPLEVVSDFCAKALTEKHADNPPDIIICSDNNALTFLQKHLKHLFPGTPVVFCGINNYKSSMLEGFDNKITGIVQELDPFGTLHLIQKLQPGVKRLVILSGSTPTAQAIIEETRKALSHFKGKDSLEILFWNKLTMEELISRLKELSKNDAILLCNFNRDAAGKYYTHKKSAKIISQLSPAPVYAMGDQYIGTGVTGGYMNTSETQGRGAGELAIAILRKGEIPPIVETSPNIAMFDSQAMTAHGLDDTLLPSDAVIINKPFSFYKTYQKTIWTVFWIILLLIVIVFILSINVARRRRSEMNLHVTLQSIGDAVISTDIKGCITQMNLIAEQLTGWQLSDAKGKVLEEVFNIVNADTRKPVQNPTEKVLQTGKIVGLANHTILISKDGTEYLIADSAAPIKYADGKLIGVVLVFRNVNEEDRLQGELRESTERYRTLFNNSLAGVLVAEIETKQIRYANPGICKMLGYSKDELFKMGVKNLHPPDKLKHVISEFEAQAEGRKQLALNIPFMKKDGGIIYADISGNSAIVDGVNCNIGLIIDVTEKRKAEKVLRDNEEKYRMFFENSSDAMLIIKDGVFIDCNAAAIKMLQYDKKEDLLNTHPSDLSPEYQPDGKKSDDKAKELIETTLANGANFFEWEHKQKGGEVFPVEVSLTAISFAGETILHTILRDISQRRKAENEVLKMQKLKSLGTLAGGIAHDFNNILLGVFGNMSLAQLELDENHPAFELINEAGKSVNRATSLTNQLLTFAKGGAPVKQSLKISDLIKDITLFTLAGSNVKPVLKETEELWEIEADKGQMQQVISNLIINANQAMPDGGTIYTTLENVEVSEHAVSNLEKGKYIKITLQDEGAGIAPQHLDHIFDPYFSTKQAGNGLGLATVYSIINKHNGDIGVTSNLGKGTTFTIYMPASPLQSLQKTAKSMKKVPVYEEKAKILIMDDDDDIVKVTKRMLTKSGFFVDTAEDGEKAIEKYKEAMNAGTPFDVVLMDLTIPGGMGGKEAIQKLLGVAPEAKVIVFSGYCTDPIMANYQNYGFKGKIEKPFQLEDLKKELARVMHSEIQ